MFRNPVATAVIAGLAIAIVAPTQVLAEESVVKMRTAYHHLWATDLSGCQIRNVGRSCVALSITNQAWEIIPETYSSEMSFMPADELQKKYTFKVYTTQDIDNKMRALGDTIDAMQKQITRNEAVLDDSRRAILLQIDKLPAELPANDGFYQQMRERLKSDIAAELDKAKEMSRITK